MEVLCKNCSNTFDGNFCPNCGQKSKTAKIDLNYLQEEAKYTFLHINNGFFFTTKELLTRPGHATREFVDGKRVRHYKPLLYLFVLAGLYGFLMSFVDIKELFALPSGNTSADITIESTEWMFKHYSLVELLYLPITAISSWLAFRKWGFNFIEHLIINCYAGGLRIAVYVITFPLMLLTTGTAWIYLSWMLISVLTLLSTAWLFAQFFSDKPLEKIILRLLLLVVLMFAITAIVGLAIGVGYAVLRLRH